MDKETEILRLFYEEHLTQTAIAEKLKISQSSISEVVNKDERRSDEKLYRTMQSKQKKKEYNKIYNKSHPKKKTDTSDKEDYERLQAQLESDIRLLSHSNNEIFDEALAKWISSAYHVGKSGNLLLDKNLRGSIDLPKIIRRDAKIGVQNYKKKFVHSS